MKSALLLSLLAVSVSAAVAAPVNDPSWPMYQGNAQHDGFVDRDLMSNPGGTIEWFSSPSTLHYSGVAVGGGYIFLTTNALFDSNNAVIALLFADGTEAWRQTFPNAFTVNPPAYDDVNDLVYLQTCNHSGDTWLHRLDIATGSALAALPFEAQWEWYQAPTLIDGQVYINGGYYGGMYAFDPVAGTESWYASLPQYDQWTPSQYGDDKLVTWTDKITISDRATGAEVDTIANPVGEWGNFVPHAVAVSGDIGYVVGDGMLHAYDLAAGEVAWSTPDIQAMWQPATDGKAVAVIVNAALQFRDPADGSLLWEWQPDNYSIGTQVILFRNHAVVRSLDDTVLIDRRTHQEVKRWPVAGKMAYADNHLIVVDEDGVNTGQVTSILLRSTPFISNGFE